MATKQNNRIRPIVLQADLDVIAAVQAISGYTPTNTAYSLAKIEEQTSAYYAAQEKERAAQATLDSARDDAAEAEKTFHEFALALKEQVIAQFGKNSNEVQTLGLKKKSEYKSPARKTAKAA
jgi:hypothetical protein